MSHAPRHGLANLYQCRSRSLELLLAWSYPFAVASRQGLEYFVKGFPDARFTELVQQAMGNSPRGRIYPC
jgi:hypothetical protein